MILPLTALAAAGLLAAQDRRSAWTAASGPEQTGPEQAETIAAWQRRPKRDPTPSASSGRRPEPIRPVGFPIRDIRTASAASCAIRGPHLCRRQKRFRGRQQDALQFRARPARKSRWRRRDTRPGWKSGAGRSAAYAYASVFDGHLGTTRVTSFFDHPPPLRSRHGERRRADLDTRPILMAFRAARSRPGTPAHRSRSPKPAADLHIASNPLLLEERHDPPVETILFIEPERDFLSVATSWNSDREPLWILTSIRPRRRVGWIPNAWRITEMLADGSKRLVRSRRYRATTSTSGQDRGRAVTLLALRARGAGCSGRGRRSRECVSNTSPIRSHRRVQPRLSWRIASARRNTMQAAYQLQVATSEAILARGANLLWDSGEVTSTPPYLSTTRVPPDIAHPVLLARTRLGPSGRASPWSRPSFWETGLCSPPTGTARWIGPAANHQRQSPIAIAPLASSFQVRAWSAPPASTSRASASTRPISTDNASAINSSHPAGRHTAAGCSTRPMIVTQLVRPGTNCRRYDDRDAGTDGRWCLAARCGHVIGLVLQGGGMTSSRV